MLNEMDNAESQASYDLGMIGVILILTLYHYLVCRSIYTVHDEVKDKAFELELSWVSQGNHYCYTIFYEIQVQSGDTRVTQSCALIL